MQGATLALATAVVGYVTDQHHLYLSAGLTFSAVSAESWHSCGLTSGGAAYCWGANFSGSLGDGTTTQRTAPLAVTGGLTFGSVSVGNQVTCGVTTESVAYCWGNNGAGALGNGQTADSHVPVKVSSP